MRRLRHAPPRVRVRPFACIYADPPWEYDDKCCAGERGIEWVHECMTDEEILDLGSCVEPLAAEDSVLFLWCVWPKLELALDVMRAWGFRYKTIGFNWIKVARNQKGVEVCEHCGHRIDEPRLHWGMGHFSRANSEVCLLGTRGRPKARSHGVHSVAYADDETDPWDEAIAGLRARGDDVVETLKGPDKSAKPPVVRERIRKLTFPRRLELFHRGATPTGWWAWGNEAEGPRLVTL